jgi:DNA-binding IclR family transcriptional regulator
MKERLDGAPNQSLAKGLAILESFSAQQPEWGIRELGRQLDVNPTTIQRLVTTFQSAGYLEQNVQTRRYRLGPKLVKLAGVYAHLNPLSTLARRVFEQYEDSFDYNFYLGQLKGFEVIYRAVLDGHGPLKVVVEPGGSTSLHATALGKVLLAFQDEAFVDGFIVQSGLNPFTARSISDPQLLREQLFQVREQQYAVNDGEFYDDVGAVGVPIFDQLGRVHYGISLAYPRHKVKDGEVDIGELVTLARRIASDIAPYTRTN